MAKRIYLLPFVAVILVACGSSPSPNAAFVGKSSTTTHAGPPTAAPTVRPLSHEDMLVTGDLSGHITTGTVSACGADPTSPSFAVTLQVAIKGTALQLSITLSGNYHGAGTYTKAFVALTPATNAHGFATGSGSVTINADSKSGSLTTHLSTVSRGSGSGVRLTGSWSCL